MLSSQDIDVGGEDLKLTGARKELGGGPTDAGVEIGVSTKEKRKVVRQVSIRKRTKKGEFKKCVKTLGEPSTGGFFELPTCPDARKRRPTEGERERRRAKAKARAAGLLWAKKVRLGFQPLFCACEDGRCCREEKAQGDRMWKSGPFLP